LRGDAHGYEPGMVIVIVVIALVVVTAGIVLAVKGFTRGTMPSTPSEDTADRSTVGAGDADKTTADPRAMGRPSDRGYEQKLK
jgi:hypothetical protein